MPNQRIEYCNNLIEKLFDNNNVFIYLAYNESKSEVAERFIRTLKGKIHKKRQVILTYMLIF